MKATSVLALILMVMAFVLWMNERGQSQGAVGAGCVEDEGTFVQCRPLTNLVGALVTATDNPTENRVDITLSSAYTTVADSGVALTQRGTINFVDGTGAAFSCVDNASATRTDCSVSASAAAGSGYDTIQNTGSAVTQRTTLNFIGSANAALTCVDNGGSSRTDCTVYASSASGGYVTVQDGGSALTQRATLNFIDGSGAAVLCVDNGGSARTDCTFNASVTTAYATIQNTGSSITQRSTVNFIGSPASSILCVDNPGSSRSDCTVYASSTYYSTIQAAGTAQTQRSTLNFISGTGATVNCADNSGSGRTDCTVLASGTGSSGYTTVADDGSALTQRSTLNFIDGAGAALSCVDNGGSLRTDCTVNASVTTAYSTVQNAGSSVTQRSTLNFINGAGAALSCVDNGGSLRTDCTVAASVTTAYATVQDNGSTLTQRAVLNFINGSGATVSCVDNGGSVRTDCTVNATLTSAYTTIQNTGSSVTQRAIVNFIGSSNAALLCVDNSGSSRTDCTVYASAAAGGYTTVQEEGTPLTQRANLNFIGGAITAADDAGNSRTNITLSASPDSASVVGTGRTLTGGAGIAAIGDLSADRTISFDSTELHDLFWGDGSQASWNWTFNVSGATDPVVTFTSNVLNLATGTLQQGGVAVVLQTRQINTTFPLTGGGALSSDLTLACASCITQAYATIQDEGSNLTQRNTLDFTGTGITCADVPGSLLTRCTISGVGGGDSITVLGVAATDPDFIDGDIDWTLDTGASPDTISATVACTDCVTLGSETIGAYVQDLLGGAGITVSGGGGETATITITTASSEADFLTSGALTCGANTQGKIQVHTTALQYCDNTGTPTLRYAAYGNSSGEATAIADDTIVVGDFADNDWGDVSVSSNVVTIDGDAVALGTDTTNAYVADITGGDGISVSGGGGETATITVTTASSEQNFLASGALTCGAGTRGKIQVHTTPLQYCDNAGTPVLQYAAYGDSSGNATGLVCTTCVDATDIASDAVTEPKLKAIDAAGDEECLTYEVDSGGDFEWQTCGGGSGDSVSINGAAATDVNFIDGDIDFFIDTAPDPDTVTATVGCIDCVTLGSETVGSYVQSLLGGAGITVSGGDIETATITVTTASSEADFLTSGALTCGGGTQGKIQVHTTALQYCDNSGTPTLRYAAYGNSSGEATAIADDTVVVGDLADGDWGDISITSNVASIDANSVTLGSDTTGAYVQDLIGGDGITVSGGGGETATITVTTASSEQNFLTSGALTCGASTNGKIQVHTTPLQYCDNAGTPTLRYAAYGDSSGNATGVACSSCVDVTDIDQTDSFTWTGNHDLGGATGLEVPNGTGPTVDATGEVAVDTTDDQLVYQGASSTRILTFKKSLSFFLASPTSSDDFLLKKFPDAITLVSIDCITDPADAGENIAFTLQERNSTGDSAATMDVVTGGCDSDGAQETSFTDGGLAAGGWMSMDVGTASGTISQLIVTVTYTIDRE